MILNLDGKVDGVDYAMIDAGFALQGTASPRIGWLWGDFSYDGVINGARLWAD